MSLKDQMLKAGLISEQQARQADHRQRVKKKKTTRQEREQEKQVAKNEAQAQLQKERTRDRELGEKNRSDQQVQEERRQQQQRQESALAAVYREGEVQNWEGPRRYYYAREGRIDILMLTDEMARRMESGKIAIVAAEKNPRRVTLLQAGSAKKLREAAPERIVVFHEVR